MDDTLGNFAFNNLAFKGSAVVMDSGCPANTMYFLNMDHLRLFLHKDRQWVFEGFSKPVSPSGSQDVEVGFVFAMGNFFLRKPSSCGVYQNISNA
jgi:hypothetical protein